MKRSKLGFTYIETCITLFIFMIIVLPFCTAHITTIKTKVSVDQIEEVTQNLERLTSEIKQEIARCGTFSPDKVEIYNAKTDQYKYQLNCYKLETLPSHIPLSANLVQLLKENSKVQQIDALVLFDAEGLISSQINQKLYIGERAKIKSKEKVVGIYLDIAKGSNYFNTIEEDKMPVVVMLDFTKLQRVTPFTVKVSNSTNGPLILQLKGNTTSIHFVIEDPSGQTTLIQDEKQSQQSQYQIVTIEVNSISKKDQIVAHTLFFQRYDKKVEDKDER